MTDLGSSYAHCEGLVRENDRDGWLAALFAPASARPHLHALAAFAIEVGRVRERVHQPMAGEIRLQWWQDVVDGGRQGEAAAHPVAAALVDTMARFALPPALLGDMLGAYRVELYDEPPTDIAAAERRFVAMFGTLFRLAAGVLGGSAEAIEGAADDAGVAVGIVRWLRDLPRVADGRRVLLPAGLLQGRGSSQAEVDAGVATPALRLALADLRGVARARLVDLRRRNARLGAAGPAFLTTSLVEPRLKLMERRDPFVPGPDLPQWRRQWILWRAARRGGVG